MMAMKPCTDYLPQWLTFSGALVIWKIVSDSRSNINNSVISRSFFFFELRGLTSRRRKTFGSGVPLASRPT